MEKTNKAKLIELISEHRDSDLVRLFIALVDNLIEEYRLRNDTARPEEIPLNQGAIMQLKSMRDIFEKRPVMQKSGK
jgi:hypothetical protein